MSNKELKNYLNSIDGVSHITLNPNGPGAVRIHLVPPQKPKLGLVWAVILNGQDVLPLTTGWAILLREFINQAIKYDGVSLNDNELVMLIKNTIQNVKKVFPKTPEQMLKEDLADILDTLVEVARGEEPDIEIGYMTLSRYGRYMSAPHRMDLMISSMSKDGHWHCNQKCMHCYAGEQVNANVKELTTDEWKKIIDKCRKAWIPELTFTGGEPTLRDDLVELIDYSKWFVTRLNTNGVLLTESLCKDLMDASLDAVQITLYSSNPSIHNLLVGAPNFDKTIEGIKNALSAGLNVSVNTPLCTLNQDYIKTLKFLKNLGVIYFSCSGLIQTGNATNDNSKDTIISHDDLLDLITKAVDYCKEKNLELAFTSPGWLTGNELEKLHLTIPSCGACLSNMAISPDGSIIPCQSWLSDDVLGNMLTDEWKKVWNSKQTKKIRKASMKNTEVCPLSLMKKEKK